MHKASLAPPVSQRVVHEQPAFPLRAHSPLKGGIAKRDFEDIAAHSSIDLLQIGLASKCGRAP